MATLPTEPAGYPSRPVSAAPIPFPPKPFPWKARVIGEMTLLFGPLAGAIVTGLTLRRADARHKALWTLVLGAAASVLIASILFNVLPQTAVVLALMVQLGGTAFYLHLQRDELENWERRYPGAVARNEVSALGWALLGLVVFFLLAPLVSSGLRADLEYRMAARAARAQAPAAAVAWYRRAAELGHAQAQYEMGEAYETGYGVPLNPQEAMHWYRLAAEEGVAEAQFNVGRAYYQGLGVSRDYPRARAWLEKSADQGYPPALYLLAEIYDNGTGVPLDDARAVALYRKSAEVGYVPAQLRLGTMYALGEGVRPDREEARRWWMQAAQQGDSSALLMLGSLALDQGERITGYMWLSLIPDGDPQAAMTKATLAALQAQMSPAEVEQARKLAEGWKTARGGSRP